MTLKSFQSNNWELSGGKKKGLRINSHKANGILKDKAGYMSSYILSFTISELYAAWSQN